MKLLARIISRVFDPFIEVPLILAVLVPLAYINGFRWRFLLLLFILDALIPGLVVVYLWFKRKRQDWDLHATELRLPLYTLAVITQGISVIVVYLLDRQPLANILFGLWLTVVAFAFITFFWKISLHAGVNTILLFLLTVFAHIPWWWWSIVPLVAWARIVHKDHTFSQVLVGAILPLFILTTWFIKIGLL